MCIAVIFLKKNNRSNKTCLIFTHEIHLMDEKIAYTFQENAYVSVHLPTSIRIHAKRGEHFSLKFNLFRRHGYILPNQDMYTYSRLIQLYRMLRIQSTEHQYLIHLAQEIMTLILDALVFLGVSVSSFSYDMNLKHVYVH